MSRESIDFKYFVTHILWKRNWFQAKRCYSVVFKSSKAGKCKGNPFVSLSNPGEPYISMEKSVNSQFPVIGHSRKRMFLLTDTFLNPFFASRFLVDRR